MKRIPILLVIISISTLVFAQTIPTDGLVAFYPFNGNANDESGNGHDGLLYGPTLSNDRFGNQNSAYLFDGINDSIVIGRNPGINVSSPMTISVWIKSDILDGGFMPVITDYTNTMGFYTHFEGDNTGPLTYMASSNFRYYSDPDSYYNDGKWHHYVFLVSGFLQSDISNARLFVDGVELNPQNTISNNPCSLENLGIIGAALDAYFYEGSLDDIRIYSRVLSESEITILYQEGGWNPISSDGLIADYSLNGDAVDESGSGGDGILYGPEPSSNRFNQNNQAMSFDGVDDYIEIPTEHIRQLSEGSFSCWLYISDLSELNNIFSIGNTSSTNSKSELSIKPNGVISFFYRKNSSPPQYWYESNESAILENRWYHLVLIQDKSSGIKIYLNGEEVFMNYNPDGSPSGTEFFADFSRTPTIATFGARKTHLYNDGFFNGYLDDIRFYDQVLTDSQVSMIYKEGGWTGDDSPIRLKVRFSYTNGGGMNIIKEIGYDYSEDVKNLSVLKGSNLLKMDGLAYNSRMFELSAYLLNDGELIHYLSTAFEINNVNQLNADFSIEVLYNDDDISDNKITESFEIWMADFEYEKDNYKFPNWQMSKSEIGISTAQIYSDPEWIATTSNLPIKFLNTLLFEYVSKGGHCYGMASTSLIYKNNPEWLLNNIETYELNETVDVKNNIQYAFGEQSRFWPRMAYNALSSYNFILGSRINNRYANTQLEFIKKSLSENKLLISNYDIHCTVLHTMIKESDSYFLYEYDNVKDVNLVPQQRGKFLLSENELELYIGSRNSDEFKGVPRNLLYYFDIPNFEMPNKVSKSSLSIIEEPFLNNILDTIVSFEIDSLINSGEKVILYTDDSYLSGDSTSNCDILVSTGVIDSFDFVNYKVYYLDPTFSGSIEIDARRPGNFSIHLFNSESNKQGEIIKKTSFDNQYLASSQSTMLIKDPFNSGVVSAEIDSDGDEKYDIFSESSQNEITPFDENKPPTLIKYIPNQEFTIDKSWSSFDLREYISDEDLNHVSFEIDYDTIALDVTIIDWMLTISAIQHHEEIGLIKIEISDEENTIILPIQYRNILYSGLGKSIPSNEILVTPNPFKHFTEISFPYEGGIYKLDMFDIQGRIVLSYPDIRSPQIILNRGSLDQGIYFIQLKGERIFIAKIVLE